ncbi:MAG: OmpA family protein [Pseudomonadota bacterium]
MRRALFLAAVLTPLALASAEEPLPSFLDAGAPEGAEVTAQIDRAFDRYRLPVGRFAPDRAAVRPLDGRVIWHAYRLDDPDMSTVEVMASYRARLEALGYAAVFDCATEACGGFDFRFAAQVLPAPAMVMDTADFAQATMRRAPQTGSDGDDQASEPEAFASILVSRVLSSIYAQTVVVVPGDISASIEASDATDAPAAKVILEQDETVLLERLLADGHVAIDGLEFRTGDSALSPTSEDALKLVVRVLTRNPDMRVAIVGHSDNDGALQPNIDLSQQRAETVMQELVGRGVAPGQMSAHGVGWLSPIASNQTPAGRATNRRVELVLR